MKRIRKAALATVAGALGVAGAIHLTPPAEAQTHVGRLWEHRDYGGESHGIYHVSDGYRCTPSTADIEVRETGSQFNDDHSTVNLDNQVSSYQGTAGCWIKLYENSNYTGRNTGWAASTPYVGDHMNDKASSVRVT
jgi:hypothetical protein